jgi:hypothetical protein
MGDSPRANGQVLPFFLSMLTLAACNSDYTVPLPNGYFVGRVYSGAFAVVRPDNRVVTRVTEVSIMVAVVGDIVLGENDPQITHPRRYFVLNTKTREAWIDLTYPEYRAKLRELEIPDAPELVMVRRSTKLSDLRGE